MKKTVMNNTNVTIGTVEIYGITIKGTFEQIAVQTALLTKIHLYKEKAEGRLLVGDSHKHDYYCQAARVIEIELREYIEKHPETNTERPRRPRKWSEKTLERVLDEMEERRTW